MDRPDVTSSQASRATSYGVEPDDVDDDVFEVADDTIDSGGSSARNNWTNQKDYRASVMDLKVRKEQVFVDTGYPGYVAPTPPAMDKDPSAEDMLHKVSDP